MRNLVAGHELVWNTLKREETRTTEVGIKINDPCAKSGSCRVTQLKENHPLKMYTVNSNFKYIILYSSHHFLNLQPSLWGV